MIGLLLLASSSSNLFIFSPDIGLHLPPSIHNGHGPIHGTIVQDEVDSAALGGQKKPFLVYLPPSYNTAAPRAKRYPVLYLLHGSPGKDSDWFTGGSRFWSVGPTVQWRIFDAGRIRANIKVQNARQEQALAAYEQTVLTAFEEVEDNLVLYAKEQVRRRSLEDAVAASQKSLDTANKLYASGLTDFLHVLDAERSLYQSQDALAQSDRTVSANLIALYKSLGGGWETVAQPVALASAQTTK